MHNVDFGKRQEDRKVAVKTRPGRRQENKRGSDE